MKFELSQNNIHTRKPVLKFIEAERGIYASNQHTIIGSDNALLPTRRHAIIGTNAGILRFWPLETNMSEMSIEIHTFSFNKMQLKMLSAKCRQFCLGLNSLKRNLGKSRSPVSSTRFVPRILQNNSPTNEIILNGRNLRGHGLHCVSGCVKLKLSKIEMKYLLSE